MTTKAQELETLGKIRELLGTLDADGWVNMAFKGVCDIAENNIRDDFGNSPVERVEELEKQLETAKKNMENWKSKAISLKADNSHIVNAIDARRKEYEKLVLKNDALRKVLEDLKSNFEYDLTRANAEILDNCAEADSEIFKNAVALRKNAQYWSDKIGEVI